MMILDSKNPKLSTKKHPEIFPAATKMMPFVDEHQKLPAKCSKFLAAASLRSFCFPCIYSSVSVSSEYESPLSYVDDKHVIILTVRGGADLRRKTRQSKNTSTFSEDGLQCWVLSPPTLEKPLLGHKIHDDEEEEQKIYERGKDDKNDDEDDKETIFFSVKSYFSQCSTNDEASDVKKKHMMLEELGYPEGWPFGLWKKPVVLPPLPRSPADSWTWNKRGRKASSWGS